MSEHKLRERQMEQQRRSNAPKSHQLSLVSITMDGNTTAAFYSIHEREQIEKDFSTAKVEGGIFRVETGDRTNETHESIVLIPAEKVMLLAVAKISHVAVPETGIITLS